MKARFEVADFTGPRLRYATLFLHGGDTGLVMERADQVTRAAAGTLDDPFRVATLVREDHGAIGAELSARSLSGGRRVVRVRDCTDRTLPALLAWSTVPPGDTLLIATAGVLTRKSKLRDWAEGAQTVAAVTCDADTPAMRRAMIERLLATHQLRPGPDVVNVLTTSLPAERYGVAAELEKLALLATPGATLEVEQVRELLDEGVDGSITAAVDAAIDGEGPAAIAAWEQAVLAGGNGVGLTRILGGEVLRLAQIVAQVRAGAPLSQALQSQRIFPRDPRSSRFTRAADAWGQVAFGPVLADIHAAEAACKRTGADDRLLAGRLLMAIASRAAHGRRYRRGAPT